MRNPSVSPYVIFDFDGTLVQSNAIKKATFFDVVSGVEGGAAAMEDILRGPGAGNRFAIFAKFVERLAHMHQDPDAECNAYVERYTLLCDDRIATAPEITGAREALEVLTRAGCQCFVCSATPTEPLRALVGKRTLTGYFTGVYGCDDKVACISQIVISHGIPLNHLVVVGDGEDDRAAAQQVGCRFVAIGMDSLRFGAPPEILIPDLRLLPEYLISKASCVPGKETRQKCDA